MTDVRGLLMFYLNVGHTAMVIRFEFLLACCMTVNVLFKIKGQVLENQSPNQSLDIEGLIPVRCRVGTMCHVFKDLAIFLTFIIPPY